MFRRQHPNAPGLFSGLRPHPSHSIKSSLRQEWSRNATLLSVGVLMASLGLGIILWNESKNLVSSRSLDEGHRKVIVPETTDVVFEENNGKLVLIADELKIEDTLEDLTYGISVQAIKLRKKVQMYQWYEHQDRKEVQGGAQDAEHDGHVETTFSYNTEWFDKYIDSEDFESPMGHHNPEHWPMNSTLVTNERVKLGNFLLGTDLKEKFQSFTVFTSDERPSNPDIKMHAGLYFHAQDVWKPEVGDLRIQFSYAGHNGDHVTIVGRQSGREIRPFKTESGEELLIMQEGLLIPEEVFHLEHVQNRSVFWIYRMSGLFVAFLGFNILQNIFDILALKGCIIPGRTGPYAHNYFCSRVMTAQASSLVGIEPTVFPVLFLIENQPAFRSGFVLGYLSLPLVVSLVTSGIIIGFSWIMFKPLMGLSILFMSTLPALIGYIRQYRRDREGKRHRLH